VLMKRANRDVGSVEVACRETLLRKRRRAAFLRRMVQVFASTDVVCKRARFALGLADSPLLFSGQRFRISD